MPQHPGVGLARMTGPRAPGSAGFDSEHPRQALLPLGLDLERVTFRGKNRGSLIFQQFPASVLARTGRDDDWAMDISGAEFSGLELRGLPSRLVRTNPEIHGVVRKERLRDGAWKKLSLGVARIVLEDIEEGDQEDGLFLVNTLDRKWRERAEDLAKLRKAGIADG